MVKERTQEQRLRHHVIRGVGVNNAGLLRRGPEIAHAHHRVHEGRSQLRGGSKFATPAHEGINQGQPIIEVATHLLK
jgi:hypothetical protein